MTIQKIYRCKSQSIGKWFRRLTILVMLAGLIGFPQNSMAENQISLGFGSVGTFQPDLSDLPQRTLYSEASWHFLFPELNYNLIFQLDGNLYLDYWNDGVSEASSQCVDCATYSFNEIAYGGRFTLFFRRTLFPLGITAGYGFHNIHQEYIGGYGYSGNVGSDHNFLVQSPELGFTLMLPVSRKIQFDVIGLRYFGDWKVEPNTKRYLIRAALRLSLW